MNQPFTTRTVEPDVTVFEISGRLTLGNRLIDMEDRMRKLVAQGTRKLVLDLASLEYVDSAGVGTLMMTAGLVREAGGQMVIARAQTRVAEVFRIVHLERAVPMFQDVDAACKSFGAAAAGQA